MHGCCLLLQILVPVAAERDCLHSGKHANC
jgi:hypothetical protein